MPVLVVGEGRTNTLSDLSDGWGTGIFLVLGLGSTRTFTKYSDKILRTMGFWRAVFKYSDKMHPCLDVVNASTDEVKTDGKS